MEINPNSFKQNTIVKLDLSERAIVSYEIVDLYGRKISSKKAESMDSGNYKFKIELQEACSYVIILRINDQLETRLIRGF